MRSIDIFGRNRSAVRRKLTDSKTENIRMEPVWKPIDQPHFLSVDLFFIDGDEYLIAFMSRLDYTAVVNILYQKTAALRESMLADILTG
jgi:hypothetical protein